MKTRNLMIIALAAPMVVQPVVMYGAADAAQKRGGTTAATTKIAPKKINVANKAVGKEQKSTLKINNTEKGKSVCGRACGPTDTNTTKTQ